MPFDCWPAVLLGVEVGARHGITCPPCASTSAVLPSDPAGHAVPRVTSKLGKSVADWSLEKPLTSRQCVDDPCEFRRATRVCA